MLHGHANVMISESIFSNFQIPSVKGQHMLSPYDAILVHITYQGLENQDKVIGKEKHKIQEKKPYD